MLYSRLENRDSRHSKFLHSMQGKLKDCIPPMLISGHQFTLGCHHQDAARKYLEAYKLLPESPLINLCVGMIFTFKFGYYVKDYLCFPNKLILCFSCRNCFNQLSTWIQTSKQASMSCTRLSIPLQQFEAFQK